MNRGRPFLPLALALLFLAAVPPRDGRADAGVAFGKGKAHLSFVGGPGYAFDDDYFVLGVGGSYYLAEGLGVGLHLETWLGGSPDIYKLTPGIQYVFPRVPVVSPYVGGFYRRSFIERLPDLDSVGARGGAYLGVGRNALVGAGLVYENYLDCDKATYRSCDDLYPELGFTLTF